MFFLEKNKSCVSHLNQTWIWKTLAKNINVYLFFFKKKLISNCIIFETQKYIYENGDLRGCYCKSDSRQGKA